MSGGASGLAGYVYQQRYLAFQILSSVAARSLPGYPAGFRISAFAVEGRGTPDGPAWDIRYSLEDGSVHLRECKDTTIKREDREVFYHRVRREMHAGLAGGLTVGWVTDPEKQGNVLAHLAGMSRIAAAGGGGVPDAPPSEVRCPNTALAEALYCLCSPRTDECVTEPLVLDDARRLLARLSLERHRMGDLEQAVKSLAEGVFSGATGRLLDAFIVGELTTRICHEKEARYTTEQFLAAVGVGTLTLLAPHELGDFLRFHSGAGHPHPIEGVRWHRLAGMEPRIWALEERIPEPALRQALVKASIGVGKSVAARQALAFESRLRNPHHAILIEAAEIDAGLAEALPRLACILCGLSPTWICIDGLDEVRNDGRERWKRLVGRLLRLPRLELIVTARQEVVSAHAWLADIGLPHLDLPPLTPGQVLDEFRRVGLREPANASLIQVLRTPLLFSLYASIVAAEDMPLAESGEVSAFHVVRAFWERTVLRASVGHRAVGDEERSQSPKGRAVEEMARQTLLGEPVLRAGECPQEVADGFETLRREGLVVHQGTLSYRWVHDWVREYAVIDHLIATRGCTTITGLLDSIGVPPSDQVRRLAASAGLKWVIAFPGLGGVEEYLSGLWARHQGYACEALAALVEGGPHQATLVHFPNDLLAEFVEQARLARAWQWRGQVAGIPVERFTEGDGRLHLTVTAYELEALA